jgi:hypothetical protein
VFHVKLKLLANRDTGTTKKGLCHSRIANGEGRFQICGRIPWRSGEVAFLGFSTERSRQRPAMSSWQEIIRQTEELFQLFPPD